MKTISFDFNTVNREFLESLVEYYDLQQKEKKLKEKISLCFPFNGLTFSEFCEFIIRKDFSHPIFFFKMGKLFTEVTMDELATHIFNDMKLKIGLTLNRYSINDNLVKLKSIVEHSTTEKLPDAKFVEEFIEEIDKILYHFGLKDFVNKDKYYIVDKLNKAILNKEFDNIDDLEDYADSNCFELVLKGTNYCSEMGCNIDDTWKLLNLEEFTYL